MRKTVQQWLNLPKSSSLYDPYPPAGDIEMGLVHFDAVQNAFKIYQGAECDGTYDINADRILSGAGFLDFLLQVHMKEWVTGQHLKDLLDCVTCWLHREHGKLPQDFFDVIGGMNIGLDHPGAP
ncbi:hypothetical protein JIN84_17885 [Luteolibacter yonseiensis]|uniref:Uncharacterized protein n=1 Tax=Luteolibacter yonseiensis TaxID=1144680 RepID=A0A934R5D7_9BACT|nr:hypothetical protein [Luteolibacter yonseiensis]MBK1817496.1 hypothetical protein [Luteolibacter yonseiensis]